MLRNHFVRMLPTLVPETSYHDTIDNGYELSWLFRIGLVLLMYNDSKILRSEVQEAFADILKLLVSNG